MSPPDAPGGLEQQAALYGAPLGDSVRRVMAVLGLSQAAVARTIGTSAPMLSQLVSGQRIKVGSPVALQRLGSLLDLADEVEAGLPHAAVAARVEAVAAEESTTLSTRRGVALRQPPGGPEAVRALLRAVASGRDLAAAAERLEADLPAVAELLRTYGTGTPEQARAHWAGLAPLL